jgi:hypothetical protein
MSKLEIAQELFKNTTNIYLKKLIENYIANNGSICNAHMDYFIRLDLCIAYIEKEKFDITGWQLFDIHIEYAHVFYNLKTEQMFELTAFEDGEVTPCYLSNGNEEDATSIQEAIEKYQF